MFLDVAGLDIMLKPESLVNITSNKGTKDLNGFITLERADRGAHLVESCTLHGVQLGKTFC